MAIGVPLYWDCRYGRHHFVLAIQKPGQRHSFTICRPNTGLSFFEMDTDELTSKYIPVRSRKAFLIMMIFFGISASFTRRLGNETQQPYNKCMLQADECCASECILRGTTVLFQIAFCCISQSNVTLWISLRLQMPLNDPLKRMGIPSYSQVATT